MADVSSAHADERRIPQTLDVQRGYESSARLYDIVGRIGEWVGARRWRRHQWRYVTGTRILELGVGTGQNIRYYPRGRTVVALDLCAAMVRRARDRAEKQATPVVLLLADAHSLPFAPETFDCVVLSFVLCCVAAPSQLLSEAHRVLRSDGRIVLLDLIPDEAASRTLVGTQGWRVFHEEGYLYNSIKIAAADKKAAA